MQFLIVDDHPFYREALRGTLLLAYLDTCVEKAGSISAACELLQEARGVDLQIVIETASLNFDRAS